MSGCRVDGGESRSGDAREGNGCLPFLSPDQLEVQIVSDIQATIYTTIYRCRQCGGHLQQPQKHRRLAKFMEAMGITKRYIACGFEGFEEVKQREVEPIPIPKSPESRLFRPKRKRAPRRRRKRSK